MNSFFPKLCRPANRFGLGVLVAVARRQGGQAELNYTALESASPHPARRPRAAILARTDSRLVASILSGLSHPDRIRVASAIMTGSSTHQLLKRAVKLKTGPLYHHLRELQMAGLAEQPARNMHKLTELGEKALLVVTALTARKPRSGQ